MLSDRTIETLVVIALMPGMTFGWVWLLLTVFGYNLRWSHASDRSEDA